MTFMLKPGSPESCKLQNSTNLFLDLILCQERAEQKRDKDSREKKTGGETEKVSRGGKTLKGGSRKADKGRRGTAEAKRSRQRLLLESGLAGSSCTSAEKKLAEESESRTVSISSSDGGDESN